MMIRSAWMVCLVVLGGCAARRPIPTVVHGCVGSASVTEREVGAVGCAPAGVWVMRDETVWPCSAAEGRVVGPVYDAFAMVPGHVVVRWRAPDTSVPQPVADRSLVRFPMACVASDRGVVIVARFEDDGPRMSDWHLIGEVVDGAIVFPLGSCSVPFTHVPDGELESLRPTVTMRDYTEPDVPAYPFAPSPLDGAW